MTEGLVHLYWGDGKGKTTAAAGLALRALGRGMSVQVVQFLKDGSSGEIGVLRSLGAVIRCGPPDTKFVSRMSDAERKAVKQWNNENLKAAMETGCDLLILDEICAARQYDLVSLELAKQAVLDRPVSREVVLTGRNPEPWMTEAADYSTEMCSRKHPFRQGVSAREGIEY